MIPNQWYAICRPQDIPRKKPLALRRLGEDIVLFRDGTGRVVCMQDRCPHKGTKLSLGKVTKEGRIACGYHGFEYDSDGECVAIPALGHDARIPKGMCTKTYRVAEKYQLIWFWYGDERPSEELPEIPMFEEFRTGDNGSSSYIPRNKTAPVHYSRWMEALSEFYHAPFVHTGGWLHYIITYGVKGKFTDNYKVEVDGNHIKSSFIQKREGDRYPQGLERFIPSRQAWNWRVEFLMPNLILLDAPPFQGMVSVIPVDEDHTVALYHSRWLWLKPFDLLPKWLLKPVGDFIAWAEVMEQALFDQLLDIPFMASQTPKASDVGTSRFIKPDGLASHWLMLRKKLKDQAMAESLTRKVARPARPAPSKNVEATLD
ncbi:MAG TPA: aromatic ring-hydroxylating dioxygenase subunit alpha [Kofleriaceae bacterium]|nr:aromatic ring-hydroxylating dioxygenase subunit alpha [Kofleriaceae bacterium]